MFCGLINSENKPVFVKNKLFKGFLVEMELSIDKITPFVRYVHYIEFIPAYTTHQQTAYDHRIFFCVQGNAKITVDSTVYQIHENSLLFVPSGTPYQIHKTKENIMLLGINFDFTINNSSLENPVAPAFKKGAFNSENLFEKYTFSDIEQFNGPFILPMQNAQLPIVQKMLDEYTTKRLFFNQKNSALLKELLVSVARELITGATASPKNTIDLVISYIQTNYMHHLTNEDIGNAVNFHPNYLNRLMLLNTGKTLHQYLLSFRLTKALDLLQTTYKTVTEIAQETGFSDVQQFCKFFLKQTGSTPSSFR